MSLRVGMRSLDWWLFFLRYLVIVRGLWHSCPLNVLSFLLLKKKSNTGTVSKLKLKRVISYYVLAIKSDVKNSDITWVVVSPDSLLREARLREKVETKTGNGRRPQLHKWEDKEWVSLFAVPPSSPSSDHKHHQTGAQSPGEFRNCCHFSGSPRPTIQPKPSVNRSCLCRHWPPGGAQLHKGPTWVGPCALTPRTGKLTLAFR